MPIMFAITIAAFVALAWAVVSTARHVRHVREQQRKALDVERLHYSPVPIKPDERFTPEPEPPVRTRPVWSAPPPPAPMPPPPEASAASATDESPLALPRFPLSSQRIRIAATRPGVTHESEGESAIKPPVPTPLPPEARSFAPLRRPPTSVPAAQPYSSYFNEEFGDLSDPEPRQRLRDRSRER